MAVAVVSCGGGCSGAGVMGCSPVNSLSPSSFLACANSSDSHSTAAGLALAAAVGLTRSTPVAVLSGALGCRMGEGRGALSLSFLDSPWNTFSALLVGFFSVSVSVSGSLCSSCCGAAGLSDDVALCFRCCCCCLSACRSKDRARDRVSRMSITGSLSWCARSILSTAVGGSECTAVSDAQQGSSESRKQ